MRPAEVEVVELDGVPVGTVVVVPGGFVVVVPDGLAVVVPDGLAVVVPDGFAVVVPDGSEVVVLVEPGVGGGVIPVVLDVEPNVVVVPVVAAEGIFGVVVGTPVVPV